MRTTPLDPDGWPTPPHAPQHAAAQLRPGSPATAHAHRALRLFVTAGVWAAGLCLVIGLLVLVVSAASPGPVGRLAAESADTSTQRTAARDPARGHDRKGSRLVASTSGRRQARHPARRDPSRLIASFAGHGGTATRTFRVSGGRGWRIGWSFSCPAGLAAGLLVVEDAAPGSVRAAISEAGTSGQGDTWMSPGGRDHRLIVISTCSWTLKVTQNS
jgi:hypothetical protein